MSEATYLTLEESALRLPEGHLIAFLDQTAVRAVLEGGALPAKAASGWGGTQWAVLADALVLESKEIAKMGQERREQARPALNRFLASGTSAGGDTIWIVLPSKALVLELAQLVARPIGNELRRFTHESPERLMLLAALSYCGRHAGSGRAGAHAFFGGQAAVFGRDAIAAVTKLTEGPSPALRNVSVSRGQERGGTEATDIFMQFLAMATPGTPPTPANPPSLNHAVLFDTNVLRRALGPSAWTHHNEVRYGEALLPLRAYAETIHHSVSGINNAQAWRTLRRGMVLAVRNNRDILNLPAPRVLWWVDVSREVFAKHFACHLAVGLPVQNSPTDEQLVLTAEAIGATLCTFDADMTQWATEHAPGLEVFRPTPA